jgi:hypothetical protein
MNLNFNTMKKSINILLITTFLVATLSSCEKEINLDLNAKSPRLVVEGNILLGLDTLIQTQEIKLSRSANYTGKQTPQPITNATVKVVEGSNTFEFTHTIDGIYRSNKFIAQVNKTYKLIIIHDGDTYEAIETLAGGPKIDSLTVIFQEGAFGDEGGDFGAINTVDPSNQENFYIWRLIINNEFLMNATPGNRYRSIQKDEFFNGQPLINYVPSDEFPLKTGDVFQIQQFNITEQMYNFYFSIFNLTAASSITGDVPPGKILGNVINKTNPSKNALGYFGACSVSIKTKKL